jgi:hypothetical protein
VKCRVLTYSILAQSTQNGTNKRKAKKEQTGEKGVQLRTLNIANLLLENNKVATGNGAILAAGICAEEVNSQPGSVSRERRREPRPVEHHQLHVHAEVAKKTAIMATMVIKCFILLGEESIQWRY